MGKHFCDRKFRSLLITGSITIVIQYLLIISDTIVIGNILGEQALAAVNVVKPYHSFAIFLSSLLSIGTSVFYSLETGKFDRKKANQLFSQGVILELLAGILLFVLGLMGKGPYFQYLNLSSQVAAEASDYFFYYLLVILLLPVYTVLLELVYADGDDRSATSPASPRWVSISCPPWHCVLSWASGASDWEHCWASFSALRFCWFTSSESRIP